MSARPDVAVIGPRLRDRRDAGAVRSRPGLRRVAALAVGVALLVGPAAAGSSWRVADTHSSLRFSFVVNGIETEGAFPSFAGGGHFDPETPEDSSLEIVVAVAEIDLGNPIASFLARGRDWFAAKEHPAAVFRLDRVESRPDGKWHAFGTLELRGVTRPMDAPVSLEFGPDRARASGEAVLDRRAFGIGRGPTAALVTVSDEIRVRFDLVAEAAERR